jgi:hypothetical protein
MAIRGFRDIVAAHVDLGQEWTQSWRKVPALATTSAVWADLSGAPGSPKPNYYVGAELALRQFKGIEIDTAPDPDVTTSPGMWTGGNVSPAAKYMREVTIQSTTAAAVGTYILCDYLAFYSLVDMDVTDTQTLDNTITLPRYTDGNGVQMFLVATNPFTGGQLFSVNYTDANGLTYDTTPRATPTTTNIGTILTGTTTGPFIPLGPAGKGVLRANSITFLGSNGGLAALVLVKPIATIQINEITAPSEFRLVGGPTIIPRIYDDAFLNFVALPSGSLSGVPLLGTVSTYWR